jgi:hypothetical protein
MNRFEVRVFSTLILIAGIVLAIWVHLDFTSEEAIADTTKATSIDPNQKEVLRLVDTLREEKCTRGNGCGLSISDTTVTLTAFNGRYYRDGPDLYEFALAENELTQELSEHGCVGVDNSCLTILTTSADPNYARIRLEGCGLWEYAYLRLN